MWGCGKKQYNDYLPAANFEFKSAFRFPELADLAGQSVNRMRHFEGLVLRNLEK